MPLLLPLCKNFVLLAIFFAQFASCKKADKEEPDEMPVFGTCEPVQAAGGLMLSSSGDNLTYTTTGGGSIQIDLTRNIVIRHKDYENFFFEIWGNSEAGSTVFAGTHENLNGKHLKDRVGSRRSVLFPDGSKITMVAGGVYDKLVSFTIYDAGRVHHFNVDCKTLEYSESSSAFANAIDAAEADGETSSFEITENGLLFYNEYIEDVPGKKTVDKVLLGELFRDEPSHVNDYYDDPRRGDT